MSPVKDEDPGVEAKRLALTVEHFDQFHREVHGYEPFHWQRQIVREIVARGEWPALVDIPTGLGKTGMLDIAVFLSALDCDANPAERVGRRRIIFVVDRRVVVDQAARHALKIAQHLESNDPGIVSTEVAKRLGELVGSSAKDGLLPVVTMRGGVTWDASWLTRPDQPGIVTGTVDQVGSRALFRGYAVSSRRWSIDAALVGTDSVILVDEAHLASAFTTTLGSAQSYDQATSGVAHAQSVVVQLTATAREEGRGWAPYFDEQAHLADPESVAAKRLTAPKSLRLETIIKPAAVKALAVAAVAEAANAGARVLVVCNTIDRARLVHEELRNVLPADTTLLLLTGRSRQYDREPIVAQVLDLFAADRGPSSDAAVLVATQTVEVGIDLDATGLVTESASWDALVQRIGRVNRRGYLGSAAITVVHDDDAKPPVYGQARIHTATFIAQHVVEEGQGDVSPLAVRHLSPPPETFSSPPSVPLLLPAHLDAWVRTAPAPVNDVPLDPYLHGLDGGVAPVSLVWRDGLLNGDGSRVSDADARLGVDVIPVRAEECVDVPIAAVRRWLVGEKQLPVSDWDADDDWDIPFAEDPSRLVLRRETESDGTSLWKWVQAAAIRPGDLIVVPSEYGGLDAYGWSPATKEKVLDVAEVAALDRGQMVLRLDSGLPRRLGVSEPDPELWTDVQDWLFADDPETAVGLRTACEARVRAWLDGAVQVGLGPWDRPGTEESTRRAILRQEVERAELQAHLPRRRQEMPVFSSPVAVFRTETKSVAWLSASDDTEDGTVHLLNPVTLEDHGEAVAGRAREIADQLKLPDELADLVEDAARWHDLGKVDPRFQSMLFEGDAVRSAIAPRPLAKSGMPPSDVVRHREARRRSGLPDRARHEAWSHALVDAHLTDLAEPYPGDVELLLHLVASHHGHARPFLPPVCDLAQHSLEAQIDDTVVTAQLPRRVDLNHAERFQSLNRRYGRWGLALLEAIVRCADQTVSGEGS